MAQKKTIVIEAKDNTKTAFNKVKKNLKQTDQAVNKTKRSFDGLKAGIKGAIGALTIGAFVQATRSTLDMADALGKTSARLGLTTSALQTLRFAATQSGMSTEMLEMSLQRFTRRMAEANSGTGVLKDTFKQLGIAITHPNGQLKNSESILGDVADKMAAIPDQGKRVELAFKMFDSEGVKMVNMLQGGKKGFDELRQSLIDTGAIMGDQFIKDAESANDAIDKLGTQFRVAFAKAISGLAPAITATASALGDFVNLAREYPVITSLATAISAVGMAFALFGGPITIALTAVSALITGAVSLNNHLKTQADLANIAGLSMDKLQKHYRTVTEELAEVTAELKEGETWWHKIGIGSLRGLEKTQAKLIEQRKQLELNIEAEKKKGEVVVKVAKKTFEVQSTIAEDHRRQQLQLSAFQIEQVKATAKAHEKSINDRKAKERRLTIEMKLEQLERTRDAVEAANQLAALSAEDADAGMARLQEEHQRRNEIIFAAYDFQGSNHASWMKRMQAEEVRHHKAVTDLYILRASIIASLASSTGQALYDVGIVGFDTMKALMIAEATINAYVAASKAWAQGGIFGAVSAGLVLAGAMANVYKIQKMQPPKREFGGPVTAGTQYMVGERGPELFTPNQSGNIASSGEGGNKSVTFNVVANDTTGFDELLQSRRGMIVGLINQSLNNNGHPNLNTVARRAGAVWR